LEFDVERILLITTEPWARNALSLLRRCAGGIEITHALDGVQALTYLSESIAQGIPYQLVIFTTPISKMSAEAVIASIRAIEKGLNRPPYPCLLCSPKETPDDFLALYSQTLHLHVPDGTHAASLVTAAALQILYKIRSFEEEHI
jgi:hypothetical protein